MDRSLRCNASAIAPITIASTSQSQGLGPMVKPDEPPSATCAADAEPGTGVGPGVTAAKAPGDADDATFASPDGAAVAAARSCAALAAGAACGAIAAAPLAAVDADWPARKLRFARIALAMKRNTDTPLASVASVRSGAIHAGTAASRGTRRRDGVGSGRERSNTDTPRSSASRARQSAQASRCASRAVRSAGVRPPSRYAESWSRGWEVVLIGLL